MEGNKPFAVGADHHGPGLLPEVEMQQSKPRHGTNPENLGDIKVQTEELAQDPEQVTCSPQLSPGTPAASKV